MRVAAVAALHHHVEQVVRDEDAVGPLRQLDGIVIGAGLSSNLVNRIDPRFIAGTGTIDSDGEVGPIGGIQQKLIGARRRGATVFLVPADNCAEALSGPPAGLKLVKVSTLKGALGELQKLHDGAATTPCTR